MTSLSWAVFCAGIWVAASNIDAVARCAAQSPRDCGRQVGQQMQAVIAQVTSQAVIELSPYLQTADGKAVFEQMLSANCHAYPEVCEEYTGIAEGAALRTTSDVFVAALSPELALFAKSAGFNASLRKQCTDYHTMDSAGRLRAWGHNEDNLQVWWNHSFLVEASIGGFSYTGFAYAPNTVGWAWGFNSHGLAQSINALSPREFEVGIGVNFLARDVLNAASIDDAVARACVSGLSSGQNFNIGSIQEKDVQVIIETSPQGCNVRRLEPPRGGGDPVSVAYHCNRYESAALRGIDEAGTSGYVSSQRRMARMQSMPPASSVRALRRVLSDSADATWPIHRDASPPDFALTFNSVVFDAISETVQVWGHDAPDSSDALLAYDWRTMRRMSSSRSPGDVAAQVLFA